MTGLEITLLFIIGIVSSLSVMTVNRQGKQIENLRKTLDHVNQDVALKLCGVKIGDRFIVPPHYNPNTQNKIFTIKSYELRNGEPTIHLGCDVNNNTTYSITDMNILDELIWLDKPKKNKIELKHKFI